MHRQKKQTNKQTKENAKKNERGLVVLEGKPIDGEERAHLWIEGESRSSSDAGRRVGVGLSEPEAARPGLIFYSPPRVRRFIFLFFLLSRPPVFISVSFFFQVRRVGSGWIDGLDGIPPCVLLSGFS